MGESPVPTKKTVSRMMSFPDALKEVIAGKKITKLEWGNPDENVFMKDGFLCIHHHADPETLIHRLMVSEGDLIGVDWMIFSEVTNEKN